MANRATLTGRLPMMHANDPQPQAESRTEQVNVRLTPSEKRDVRLVAAFEQTTESDTLRTGIDAIRARAEQIRKTAAA
jgi:hypothetical protein